MSALQSWRKAYGALKDSTTVSLANLNSDFKVRIRNSRGMDFFFSPLLAEFGRFVGTLDFF